MALSRARRASVDTPPSPEALEQISSRRARRDAEAAKRAAKKAARPDLRPWAARGAVLGALVAITVVAPATGISLPGNGSIVVGGAEATYSPGDLPSTIDALAAVSAADTVPAAIALSDVFGRNLIVAASRAELRGPLPGCDGSERAAGANGQLDQGDLCTLWNGVDKLRADAAVALATLNVAYRAKFGSDICVTDGYRTLGEQRRLKAIKGGLAASPGKSNHGWGLAIDLCRSETYGASWTWINENGPTFGWVNPAWAKPGGRGPREAWHWEYEPAVKVDGEYYGS